MTNLISIHEIAARDLRPGDRLAAQGAYGLDNWFDTAEAGENVVVLAVGDWDDLIEIIIHDTDRSITTLPDIRVQVIRPRGA